MSVRDAINRFSKKQIKKTRKREPSSRPEKSVEKEILKWAKDQGFDLTVVDSGFQRWDQRKVSESGFTDLCGNTPEGVGAFIELKAPYQKRQPSPAQYLFIRRKIESGCFAIITDSALHIESVYKEWLSIVDAEERKIFLLNQLKTPRNLNPSSIDDSPIF